MPDGPEFWDVVAMIAKAQNEERAARVRHVEDITRDLRGEFRREVMELREEVGELVAEVLVLIEREKEQRARDDGATVNMITALTEQRL